MLTEEECKIIVKKIAAKYDVSPKSIAERLLSPEDKIDMMNGDVPLESLDLHIKLWKEGGCEDMVNPKDRK